MEKSTNCSSINTPCRKIGLHRLIKSDKIIRTLNFSSSPVASPSPSSSSEPYKNNQVNYIFTNKY